MKILVTGATGFVGSHLCELLEDSGHEVFSLVRNEKKAKDFKVKGSYILGALGPSLELEWVSQLPTDLDAVIHTAGIVHSTSATEFDDINNKSTINLVNHLAKRYDNLHFTFVSSLAAGGPMKSSAIRFEDTPDMPVSLYGKSKNDAEKALLKTIPSTWSSNTLRPPMVIGPRDPAVLDIFKMVKSGVVVGPGLNFKEKEYSFICVFDLINGLKELTVKKSSGLYYISHKNVLTFEQLINSIKKSLNKSFLIYIPIPNTILKIVANITSVLPISSRLTKDKVNELIPMTWTCSNAKLTQQTGFIPSWDIDKTTLETIKDYKKRNWL